MNDLGDDSNFFYNVAGAFVIYRNRWIICEDSTYKQKVLAALQSGLHDKSV